jgi:hypothetical protein
VVVGWLAGLVVRFLPEMKKYCPFDQCAPAERGFLVGIYSNTYATAMYDVHYSMVQ